MAREFMNLVLKISKVETSQLLCAVHGNALMLEETGFPHVQAECLRTQTVTIVSSVSINPPQVVAYSYQIFHQSPS